MAEWWKSLGERALKHIDGFADSIVSQANAAQQQIIAEQNKVRDENAKQKELFTAEKPLPWETDSEDLSIFENDTMERVLQLSLREENFTVPPKQLDYVTFTFSEFIPVALRLLQLDANLARMHARLASKMKEEIFWHFYYYRIMYIRAAIGIDGPLAKESPLGSLSEDDVIIFQATKDYLPEATASSVVRRKPVDKTAAVPKKKNADDFEDEDGESRDIAVVNRKRAEAELAAEVQAELEGEDDLLDLDDFGPGDDDDDLGVLAIGDEGGDLDAELYAELEAQIAKELEES